MSTITIDPQRVEDFEQQLVETINHGALCLMISIGHRTGLFDTLAETGPVDATALAEHAGLDERYVLEWLGAMTAGRIVEHDPETGAYDLLAEHAQLITRHADQNLAVYAQYIPVFGANEDDILTCFREGGGLGYEHFPRFHEIMEEESAQAVIPALHPRILPLVPGLTDRLERGIRAVDVGCGRGRALNELASWYPNSSFTGYDLSEEAVRYARETAAARGLDNVAFHAVDAARLAEVEEPGAAQLITTFDAVHDQADPDAVTRAIRRTVADDGVYLAQDIDAAGNHGDDIDHPLGPFVFTASCLHCMTVSLAAGGAGYGAMWGRERAQTLFARAGFEDVEVHTFDDDPTAVFYVCRPQR